MPGVVNIEKLVSCVAVDFTDFESVRGRVLECDRSVTVIYGGGSSAADRLGAALQCCCWTVS